MTENELLLDDTEKGQEARREHICRGVWEAFRSAMSPQMIRDMGVTPPPYEELTETTRNVLTAVLAGTQVREAMLRLLASETAQAVVRNDDQDAAARIREWKS